MRTFVLFMLLLAAGPALAQTPAPDHLEPETVYSEAQRAADETLSRRFIQSLLAPSFSLEGQFSRWKQPVCPRVVGLAPLAAHVVERRIREVAQAVGAQIERRDPCIPNIIVFVSPEPQETLDALVARDPYRFAAAPKENLQLRYPVQAWYFGYFQDYSGRYLPDIPWEAYTDGPPQVSAKLSRLHTGLQPALATANILVDSAAIMGLSLGSLGDYLALMALSQAPATGRCQPAPSIANLFLKACGDFHSAGLSDPDLAMLRALYQTPDQPEKLQLIRLIGNMRRNLEEEARH